MSDKLPTKVVTSEVRLSYAQLFEPKAVEEGGEKKYSVAILFPKKDKALLTKLEAAIEAAKVVGKDKRWGGKIPKNLKTPIRDGDEKEEVDEAYAGHYYINCTSTTKPGVVDKNLDPVLDKDEVYSGCYGRVSINFFPFDVSGNKGIAAGLNNVQKLRDGERLSGRDSAETDFAEALEGAEDDDLL